MSCSLEVTIDSRLTPTLKATGYKLCIAKKVNQKYTVVWQGANILYGNQFAWETQYQVFGTSPFKSGALVKATTEKQVIKSGQTATLDKNGIMQPAGGKVDDKGIFKVRNDYGLINLGVNCKVNDSWAPIYASEMPIVSGTEELQPIEKVMVWFDTKLSTGCMMLKATSTSIEIDFTSKKSHTLFYTIPKDAPDGRGVWILDGKQPVLTSTYNLETNTFAIDSPSPSVLSFMTDLLNDRNKLSVPCTRIGRVAVQSQVVYEGAEDAKNFAEFVLVNRPREVATWDVDLCDNAVNVKMEPQTATYECVAICQLQEKFVQILYAFSGAKYGELSFKISGATVEGHPTEPDPLTSGTAIVRFRTAAGAAAFAQEVNTAPSADVEYAATSLGVAVTIRSTVLRPTEVDSDRAVVQKGYEEVVAAFNAQSGDGGAVRVGEIAWDED